MLFSRFYFIVFGFWDYDIVRNSNFYVVILFPDMKDFFPLVVIQYFDF